MAIDYGEKRVGIASTDETGQFAIPRAVWPNDANLVGEILKFKNSEKIDKIILGQSNNLDGTTNPIQEKIDNLKRELTELGVETDLHPEILTTVEARRLQGQTKMTDASAASLILKSYLERVYNSST